MLHLNKGNLETFFFPLKIIPLPSIFFSSLSCDHQASRGAVTTLQVVTRSLVSLPSQGRPRLHHPQKLRFNPPPSGFITGTPSGEPQEQLPVSEISNAESKLIPSFLPALPWLGLWRGLLAQGKPPSPRPPDSLLPWGSPAQPPDNAPACVDLSHCICLVITVQKVFSMLLGNAIMFRLCSCAGCKQRQDKIARERRLGSVSSSRRTLFWQKPDDQSFSLQSIWFS